MIEILPGGRNNQTQRVIGSDTYDLTYDAEGRLVQVKKNSTVFATFVYDGIGKRVKATVNSQTSAYVGGHYEYDVTNTTTRSYYGGVAMRVDDGVNNDVFWRLKDHLGGTSLTLNDIGGVHGELFYTAFGETQYSSGATPTDVRYTGQREEADLGLYFYNARWYDPVLGRFAQADTLIPNPSNPQAFDRFAYVNNNPIRYNDPSGHCIPIDDEVGGECVFQPLYRPRIDPIYGKWDSGNDYGENEDCGSKSPGDLSCLVHPGIDLGGGATVVAPASGWVYYVQGNDTGLGNYIILKVPDGQGGFYYHILGHLKDGVWDKLNLEQGQWIEIGTKIGEMGDTGKGELHLHWEIRHDPNADTFFIDFDGQGNPTGFHTENITGMGSPSTKYYPFRYIMYEYFIDPWTWANTDWFNPYNPFPPDD